MADDAESIGDENEEVDNENEASTSTRRNKVEVDHDWDSDVVCVVDGNEYWLVEEIRDVRVDNRGKLQYLVKWVDYPESINSWEPEENCSLARRLIQEFHQRMSEARKHQLGQQMMLKSKPGAAKPAAAKRKNTSAGPAKPKPKAKKLISPPTMSSL